MAGKIRTLQVRPTRSIDLSFDTSGIISRRNPELAVLGARVAAFAPDAVVVQLANRGAEGRHIWDSSRIASEVRGLFLFSLRNETQEAMLQQGIAQCELAYLERHKHRDGIANAMRRAYPADATTPSGRLQRLTALQQISERHTLTLRAAYENTSWSGVISDSITTTRHTGDAVSLTALTPVAMRNTEHRILVQKSPWDNEQKVELSQTIPQVRTATGWEDITAPPLSFPSQKTTTSNDLTLTSVTRNTEFRHPYLENLMQDQRTHLTLQDEYLQSEIFSFRVPEIERIIDKDRELHDWELRKLQVRFLQTFLTSPINGIVTTLYKDAGEWAQAGEPVARVEDDSEIYLVGIVQCRGLVRVGDRMTVRSRNLYEQGTSLSPEVSITAKVVAVRGHDSDDDEWDLICHCNNPASSPLPINYHFDRDCTRVEISAQS